LVLEATILVGRYSIHTILLVNDWYTCHS